jgi:hypothetical protein
MRYVPTQIGFVSSLSPVVRDDGGLVGAMHSLFSLSLSG